VIKPQVFGIILVQTGIGKHLLFIDAGQDKKGFAWIEILGNPLRNRTGKRCIAFLL